MPVLLLTGGADMYTAAVRLLARIPGTTWSARVGTRPGPTSAGRRPTRRRRSRSCGTSRPRARPPSWPHPRRVIGLSARASSLDPAGDVSPGRTGAVKRQSTWQARDREASTTTASRMRLYAALHDDAPKREARGRLVVVQRVAIAADLGEQPDEVRPTTCLRSAPRRRGASDRRTHRRVARHPRRARPEIGPLFAGARGPVVPGRWPVGRCCEWSSAPPAKTPCGRCAG